MVKYKKHIADYIFEIFIYLFLLFILVTTLYPFLNAMAISLNDADDTVRGGITVFPRILTFENYRRIFNDKFIFNAYMITIMRTLIGTVCGLFFTAMFAYAISKKYLIGHRFYTFFCLIPMYFSGGMIPYYFLIKSSGLINNFWVYIIPNLMSIWNMILMRTYFRGLPEELEESAKIDGARQLRIFFQIIFPVSAPIFATIALYIAVSQWNAWFDASMYITKMELKPMQTILMNIIQNARITDTKEVTYFDTLANKVSVRSITMGTMMVTVIPIVCVYPFLQRYFIKGIMVGSLKG